MPVVVLTGMRQTGKTTLVRHDLALKHRRYYSLDDFATLEAARGNPESLFSDDEPVCIDEVQRCPELLVAIKQLVDAQRLPGQFLLTGSANLALMKGVAETLAGRALYIPMEPLTRREIQKHLQSPPFLTEFIKTFTLPKVAATAALQTTEILRGGMPQAALSSPGESSRQPKNRSLWFRGFVQTYIERDVRDLSQVADLLSFRNLLQLTALRSGQLLNISELARDAKLNHATATRYLNLIETSFLLRRLPPYLASRTSRLVKSPKLYLADSGLACHIAAVRGIEPQADDPMRGPMFETYILSNLSTILEAHLPDAQLFYWHVQGRYEVDFVIEFDRECIALEIKSATRWTDRDLTGLKAFLTNHPKCRAAILCYNGTQAVQLEKRMYAIPLSMLIA